MTRRKEQPHRHRRHKALARSAALRVFVTPEGRFHLVGGKPQFDTLYDCLVERRNPPQQDGPTPAELGFAVASDGELTNHGATLQLDALSKWRRALDREIRAGRVKKNRKRKIDTEIIEIDRLRSRLGEIQRLQRAVAGGSPIETPYLLQTHEEAELSRQLAAVQNQGQLQPVPCWFARIVLWMSGPEALSRYIDAVLAVITADSSPTLAVLQKYGARLRVWRIRCENTSRAELRTILGELRDANRRLSRELVHEIGCWDLGGRSLPNNLDLLMRRCDELVGRYRNIIFRRIPAGIAALVACDGGHAPLPPRIIRQAVDDLDEKEFRETLASLNCEANKPGYDRLLAAVEQLREFPQSHDFEQIRIILDTNATPGDVDWVQQRELLDLFDPKRIPVAWLRRLLDGLGARGIVLEYEQLEPLLEAIQRKRDIKILTKLIRWLERIPESAWTPRLSRLVTKALIELVVPAMSGLACYDLLHVWATTPKRCHHLPKGPAVPAGEIRAWLERIAYYQHLAGKKPTIPKSVRKQLDAADRDAREREYLRRELAGANRDPAKEARLRLLESRAHRTGVSDISQTKLLRDAQEVFLLVALDALREVIHRAAQRLWSNTLGHPLPDGPAKRLIDFAVWIGSMDDGQRRVLHEIDRARHEHGPFYRPHLPDNGPWIAKAAERGVGLAAWFAPEPANEVVEGRPIRIDVAHEPLDIFLMGTYFGTCLSLGGINEISVLANAYDANKQVIFAYDAAGKVVARKIVAVSSDFRLLGYCCYVSADCRSPRMREAIVRAVAVYCGRFGRQCGLSLVDSGEPDEIAGHFWYDDDPHAWDDDARKTWEETEQSIGVLPGTCRAWEEQPHLAFAVSGV